MERLPAVFWALRDIDEEESGDRYVEAKGILVQTDIHFIVMLNVFNNLLCTAKYASDMLQSVKIDLSKALDCITCLPETLQKYSTETTFFEWGA